MFNDRLDRSFFILGRTRPGGAVGRARRQGCRLGACRQGLGCGCGRRVLLIRLLDLGRNQERRRCDRIQPLAAISGDIRNAGTAAVAIASAATTTPASA